MEAAGRLNVGRADRFVVCTEIDNAAADAAGTEGLEWTTRVEWTANHMQTFATDSMGETFVTARLLDTVACG
jgi:hypothetical protein